MIRATTLYIGDLINPANSMPIELGFQIETAKDVLRKAASDSAFAPSQSVPLEGPVNLGIMVDIAFDAPAACVDLALVCYVQQGPPDTRPLNITLTISPDDGSAPGIVLSGSPETPDPNPF